MKHRFIFTKDVELTKELRKMVKSVDKKATFRRDTKGRLTMLSNNYVLMLTLLGANDIGVIDVLDA